MLNFLTQSFEASCRRLGQVRRYCWNSSIWASTLEHNLEDKYFLILGNCPYSMSLDKGNGPESVRRKVKLKLMVYPVPLMDETKIKFFFLSFEVFLILLMVFIWIIASQNSREPYLFDSVGDWGREHTRGRTGKVILVRLAQDSANFFLWDCCINGACLLTAPIW